MNTKKTNLASLITPGEMLMEEFLKPYGISVYKLAQDIGVPRTRVNEIVHGRRSITTDTALRLSLYFGNSPQYWINLQANYELARIKREGGIPKIPRAQLAAAA